MPTGLVADALRRAADLRGGDIAGVIFHSDRGSQYLSAEYRELCDKLGVRQSAGRVATCFDNSAAESFWSSLKRELVHRYRFATRAEAMAAITVWIRRYNNVRLHSTIGYVPRSSGNSITVSPNSKLHNQVSGRRGKVKLTGRSSGGLPGTGRDGSPKSIDAVRERW